MSKSFVHIFSTMIVFIIFIIDYYVKMYYMAIEEFSVSSFLNIVKVWNTGISFGLLSDYSSYIIIFTSVLLIILIVYLYLKENRDSQRFYLSMITGGALGNLVDRCSYGAVYDFIDFHLWGFHWPAFNIADVFICFGALLFLLGDFLYVKKS